MTDVGCTAGQFFRRLVSLLPKAKSKGFSVCGGTHRYEQLVIRNRKLSDCAVTVPSRGWQRSLVQACARFCTDYSQNSGNVNWQAPGDMELHNEMIKVTWTSTYMFIVGLWQLPGLTCMCELGTTYTKLKTTFLVPLRSRQTKWCSFG